MTDLVKENESLKRENSNKDKEIQKLIDNIYKFKWKLNRAERRLDKINNKDADGAQKNNEEEDDDDDDMFQTKKVKNPSISFLKGNYVPKNIDFRLEYLEEEYYSIFTWQAIYSYNLNRSPY